jgi:hypothetical protein
MIVPHREHPLAAACLPGVFRFVVDASLRYFIVL